MRSILINERAMNRIGNKDSIIDEIEVELIADPAEEARKKFIHVRRSILISAG